MVLVAYKPIKYRSICWPYCHRRALLPSGSERATLAGTEESMITTIEFITALFCQVDQTPPTHPLRQWSLKPTGFFRVVTFHIEWRGFSSWPLFVRQHGQPCHSQYNVGVFPGWPVSSATITMHADTGRTSMMLHEVCGRLLPPQAALHLDTIAMEDHGLTLAVAVTTPQATCPDCTQPSTPIHSDYRRTLTDLPWATTPVTVHLRVRRFWCATPSCGRQTFAERVPQIAPHYARAT